MWKLGVAAVTLFGANIANAVEVDALVATFCNDYLGDSGCPNDVFGPSGTISVHKKNLYVNLDFSRMNYSGLGLPEDCAVGGLSYHVHKKWDNLGDATQAFAGECGSDNTGGHWDPWFACGPASGEAECAADCIPKPADGGDYDCSPENYAKDPYSCEVGDWSGKYGKIYANASMSQFSDHYTNVYEMSEDSYDSGDLSVVIHCNSGARAFCAQLNLESEVEVGEVWDPRTYEGNFTRIVDDPESDYQNFSVFLADHGYTFLVPPKMLESENTCKLFRMSVMSDWRDPAEPRFSDVYECMAATGGNQIWDPTAQCVQGGSNDLCVESNDDEYMVTRCGEEVEYSCYGYACAAGDVSYRFETDTINMSQCTNTTNIGGIDFCMVVVLDDLPIPLMNVDTQSVYLECMSGDSDADFASDAFCARISSETTTAATALFCNSKVDAWCDEQSMYGPSGSIVVSDQNVFVAFDFTNVNHTKLGLPEDCAEGGYSYHIHKSWDNLDGKQQAFGENCSAANTGGHWDPWFACGPASGESECSADCIPKPADGGTYECSADELLWDSYACEIGDLSGKYGKIDGDSYTYDHGYHIFEADMADLDGFSLVIHCNDGTRAFCTEFENLDMYLPNVMDPGRDDFNLVRLAADGDLANFSVGISDEGYTFFAPRTMLDADDMCLEWNALVHSSWMDESSMYGMNDECNDSVSGMVWDPTAQCHPLSSNDLCEYDDDSGESERCDGDAFEYECNGGYECARGDLSSLGSIDLSACDPEYDVSLGGSDYCVYFPSGMSLPLPYYDARNLAFVLTCADGDNDDYSQVCAAFGNAATRDPTPSPTSATVSPTMAEDSSDSFESSFDSDSSDDGTDAPTPVESEDSATSLTVLVAGLLSVITMAVIA